MTKAVIAAIFLSQAPIQDLRVFREQATTVDYINAEVRLDYYSRRVDTIHIHRPAVRPSVVPKAEAWYQQKPPVPYWFFWTCNFEGQTAQQCVAIHSMLEQELRQ
jgi:hypothetical protein